MERNLSGSTAHLRCDVLIFVHLERTGGTSIRETITREMRTSGEPWVCVGQSCPVTRYPLISPCTRLHHRRGSVDGMLELLGDDALADNGCRVFAELHNNDWRAASLWNTLPGLLSVQRRRGCHVSLFTVLRDPFEQIISELLYFKEGAARTALQRSGAIAAMAENLLCRLNLLGRQGWRESTPRLGSAAIAGWARAQCRSIVSALDSILFTDTLASDWRKLQRKHNLSAAPLPQAGRTNSSISATWLREHRDELAYVNRLSRATYDLLATRRHLPLAERCEADDEAVQRLVPHVTRPPPPPPPPPGAPWVCVPTNATGCRRDEDCCTFAKLGDKGKVFCERVHPHKQSLCLLS